MSLRKGVRGLLATMVAGVSVSATMAQDSAVPAPNESVIESPAAPRRLGWTVPWTKSRQTAAPQILESVAVDAPAVAAPAAPAAKESATYAEAAKPAPAPTPDACAACPKPAPKPDPYKGRFFDNDFSYLDDCCAEKDDYYELLKRMWIGERLRIDVGGEYRHQFKSENRRSLFTGAITTPRTDEFTLNRFRMYSDVNFGGWLRGYVEYIDAVSFHEDLVPLGIDENRSDLLNAFSDVMLYETANGRQTWLRAGRQELLQDAERLVSPLDWGNTRRTFEGVSVLSKGPCLDVDLFWTRPVGVLTRSYDRPDQSRWFGGAHATYKGFENMTVASYFYTLREEDVIGGAAAGATHQIGSGNHDNRTYTLGTRVNGGLDNWLWDVEGAMQFGTSNVQDIFATMFTAGIGRKLVNLPKTPTVWMWYDYASGDDNPADGDIETFNQLFPLGHKYFGWLDLVGRQNIHDLNFQYIVKPHDKLTFMTWMHLFWLADDTDALYNAAGVASRQDVTGASGSEVGRELDFVLMYALRPGVDLHLGYCHFWSGDFIENTGGQDFAYLLYTQMSIKF